MKNVNNGVTTQKSNEEMQKELNEFKPINDWYEEERNKRITLAQTSRGRNNKICPICGKEISIRERCSGFPLVNACVCSDCDKRYVFPFRISPLSIDYAPTWLMHCIDAEMLIEFAKRTNSRSTNHTDVA